jgi:hypothetical protein
MAQYSFVMIPAEPDMDQRCGHCVCDILSCQLPVPVAAQRGQVSFPLDCPTRSLTLTLRRIRYLRTYNAIIDYLTIVPLYLSLADCKSSLSSYTSSYSDSSCAGYSDLLTFSNTDGRPLLWVLQKKKKGLVQSPCPQVMLALLALADTERLATALP